MSLSNCTAKELAHLSQIVDYAIEQMYKSIANASRDVEDSYAEFDVETFYCMLQDGLAGKFSKLNWPDFLLKDYIPFLKQLTSIYPNTAYYQVMLDNAYKCMDWLAVPYEK